MAISEDLINEYGNASADLAKARERLKNAVTAIRKTIDELEESVKSYNLKEVRTEEKTSVLKRLKDCKIIKNWWWHIVLLAVFGLLMYYVVLPIINGSTRSSDTISMTQAECDLTVSAIKLVKIDMKNGTITDTKNAMKALSTELPESVRKIVIEKIGNPEFNDLESRFSGLVKKIKVTDKTSRIGRIRNDLNYA